MRHKWYVFVECCKLGIPWLGVIHDFSKFRVAEWKPYVDYFYGDFGIKNQCPAKWVTPKCCRVKEEFDVAWLHHQHHNKHHWQWWTLRENQDVQKIIPMPLKYAKEMLADWRGAGKAQGKPDAKAWYEKNKNNMLLHPETRQWIEEQLGV